MTRSSRPGSVKVGPLPDLLDMILLELDSASPAGRAWLTDREATRLAGMSPRRARSFLGARAALKQLARNLASDLPAPEPIETLALDQARPLCGAAKGFATASHDDRFVAAGIAARPCGLDVERISRKPVRGAHLFLDEEERGLGAESPEIATRLWTVKEAGAKALDLPLAEAWTRIRILETGEEETVVDLAGVRTSAHHRVIDGHVLTSLVVPMEEMK